MPSLGSRASREIQDPAIHHAHDSADATDPGYVLPAFQRRGIGSRLLAHLEAEAPRASRLIAGTYAANFKARRLLERVGYRLSADPKAVLRAYYAIPEDRQRSSVTYERDA